MGGWLTEAERMILETQAINLKAIAAVLSGDAKTAQIVSEALTKRAEIVDEYLNRRVANRQP